MRKKVFINIIILLLLSAKAISAPFTITGTIKNQIDSVYVKISYEQVCNSTYNIIKEDSVIVLQEKFLFHGDVSGLTAAIIEYNGIRYRFYVEPGDIHLYIDSQKPYELKLKGTTVDDELSIVQHFLHENDSLLFTRYEQYQRTPYAVVGDSDYFDQYLKACKEREELLLQFCEKNPHYTIAPDLLYQAIDIDIANDFWRAKSIEKLKNSFSAPQKMSLLGKLLEQKMNIWAHSQNIRTSPLGCIAPDFTVVSDSQECIRLNSYRNKENVLMFFYPYKTFKKSYFQKLNRIIGSLKEKDLKIIGVVYRHECTNLDKVLLKGNRKITVIRDNWNNDLYQIRGWELCSLYAVGELPYTILIDKNGIISKIF